MKRIFLLLMVVMPLFASAQDGTYKDLFMDSGIMLTSRTDLPAARLVPFSMEAFISTQHSYDKPYAFTAADTLLQQQMFVGSAIDENGILLYPDGAPRFRCIYVNGGKSGSHGRSLTEAGLQRLRDYVKAGGSYVGSCAGAFLASVASIPLTAKDTVNNHYSHIWPGYMSGTKLENSSTQVILEPNSPLLNYYNYGGKMVIDSVRHNGGGYARMDYRCPEGTEVLARYGQAATETKRDIVGQPVIWAWKEQPQSGRIVLCGSHPESVTEGARLELTAAMLKYAMDGCGIPRLKGTLTFDQPRRMVRRTHDNIPEYTCIGDRQYHHFKVDVPEHADSLEIILEPVGGWDHYDLYLLAAHQGLAFLDKSDYKDLSLGITKTLTIPHPQQGPLYISVYCATTVDARWTDYGTQYSGRLDVLNGVPYVIQVRLKNTQ